MGRWIAGDLAPDDPMREPDLIVGDFNTPAHAWSVEAFSPTTRNARTDAGEGPPGTFPATEVYAPFEIDIARLGDNTRATHLAKIRAEGCRHFGLLLDLDLE